MWFPPQICRASTSVLFQQSSSKWKQGYSAGSDQSLGTCFSHKGGTENRKRQQRKWGISPTSHWAEMCYSVNLDWTITYWTTINKSNICKIHPHLNPCNYFKLLTLMYLTEETKKKHFSQQKELHALFWNKTTWSSFGQKYIEQIFRFSFNTGFLLTASWWYQSKINAIF